MIPVPPLLAKKWQNFQLTNDVLSRNHIELLKPTAVETEKYTLTLIFYPLHLRVHL